MKRNKYEKDDKLIIHSTPEPASGVSSIDGEIVTVVAYPGHSVQFPEAYGVVFSSGLFWSIHPRFLRKLPLAVPTNRGDIDVASNWEAFDKATKLDSSTFRFVP